MDEEEMFRYVTVNLATVKCSSDIEECLRIIAQGKTENTVKAVIALACSCFVKGSVEVLK